MAKPEKKLEQILAMGDKEAIEAMGFDSQPSVRFPDVYPELVEPFEDRNGFFRSLENFRKNLEKGMHFFVRKVKNYSRMMILHNTMVEPFRHEIEKMMEEHEKDKGLKSSIIAQLNQQGIPKEFLEDAMIDNIYINNMIGAVEDIENSEEAVKKDARRLDRIWLALEYKVKNGIDKVIVIDPPDAEAHKRVHGALHYLATVIRSIIFDRQHEKQYKQIVKKLNPTGMTDEEERKFFNEVMYPKFRGYKKDVFLEQAKEDFKKITVSVLNTARTIHTIKMEDSAERIDYEIDEIREKWLRELMAEHFQIENVLRLRKYLRKCLEEDRIEDYAIAILEVDENEFHYDFGSPSGHETYFEKLFESALDKAEQKAFETEGQYDLYFTIVKESYLYDSDIEQGFANKRGLFNTKPFAEFIKALAGKPWKEKYLELLERKPERKILLNKENFKLLESYEDSSLLDLIEYNHTTLTETETGVFRKNFHKLLLDQETVKELVKTDGNTAKELLKTYLKHSYEHLINGLAKLSNTSTKYYREVLELVRNQDYTTAEFMLSLEEHDLKYWDDFKRFISSQDKYSKELEGFKDESLPENLKQKIEQAGLLEKNILELENKGEKIRKFFELLPEVGAFQNKDKKIKQAAFGIKNKKLYSCLEMIAEKTGYFHNLDLSQFKKRADSQYVQVIEMLSQLRARQIRTIARENSEAGKLFYYVMRYSDESAAKELLEELGDRDKAGKDLEKFLQHKYDACLSALKTRIKEKISNPSARQEIDIFIDTALKDQIERFYEFIELDKEGKYLYENIPVRVSEIIQCEQHNLLDFAYQQVKKDLEPEKLNDILTFYQDDKDFEDISPKEMGMLD